MYLKKKKKRYQVLTSPVGSKETFNTFSVCRKNFDFNKFFRYCEDVLKVYITMDILVRLLQRRGFKVPSLIRSPVYSEC